MFIIFVKMQEGQNFDYISFLSQKPIMRYEEISKTLPHRYPFLFVDKVLLIEEFKQIIASKNVTANEEFFNGHFPSFPIMPGVIMIEAMAQVSGILGIRSAMQRDNITELKTPPSVFLMSVDNVKFRQMVVPGDTIIIQSQFEKIRGDICVS